ncbi:hypothetical protein LX99_02135 [Mucilaginibacter oryzae]|uniref:DUF2306 domain-containing protein n=1 Tax=Mucilaginibacter oryzae TaxID=468058 RepID=A0A316HJA2_9SPHI|nr:hypothetical protein [Mucilaginibacter oryzae]PWK78295.1 hypothetical protein LX99_02135 [Mucilaginibacter oryzae]
MPNALSTFGAIHTAISIVGVAVGFMALFQDGKISPQSKNGKIYGVFTVLACLSSFLVMKTGHLSSAHNLSFLILILLPFVYYAPALRIFDGKADYVQTVGMTATLFFSLVPAVVETLTRLPVEQPLANGPDSPVVKTGLLVLLTVFAAIMIYQAVKLRKQRKAALSPSM